LGEAFPGLAHGVPAVDADEGAQAFDGAPDAVDDDAVPDEGFDPVADFPGVVFFLDRVAPGEFGVFEVVGFVAVLVFAV